MLFNRHVHGDHVVHAFKTFVCGAHLIVLQTFNYVLCGWLHQHVLDVHANIFNHVFLELRKKNTTTATQTPPTGAPRRVCGIPTCRKTPRQLRRRWRLGFRAPVRNRLAGQKAPVSKTRGPTVDARWFTRATSTRRMTGEARERECASRISFRTGARWLGVVCIRQTRCTNWATVDLSRM